MWRPAGVAEISTCEAPRTLQFLLCAQASDRGPEVGLDRVPELFDEGVPFERLLDDPSLDALAAAVNQADFAQSGGMRCGDVFLDDGLDVAGCEGMQIERVFDRDAVRHEAA